MAELFQFKFSAMGGENEIRLYASSYEQAQLLCKPAIDEVFRLEKKYSRYRQDSLISEINAGAGKNSVTLDEESFHLFQVSDHWFKKSNGLFDITTGILRRVWNTNLVNLPDTKLIQDYLSLIGWYKVVFGNSKIYLPTQGMEVDLGGIAKEYAVDRASQILLDLGVESGIVNLGGDIRVLGPHLDGSAWLVQISHPNDPNSTLASLYVAKGAVTTSGDYVRYLEIKGKRYSHIFNPKSGFPVSYWKSATCLAPLCLMAGYASTVAMLAEEDALDLLNKDDRYILLNSSNQILQNIQ